MSFMTPILMAPSVYCACAPGHPRVTASAVRLMSRFIGVYPLRRFCIFASVQTLGPRTERFYRALALRRRSAIRLELARQYDPAVGFMRLSRITRTPVSAGKMKPQLERQPEILR